MFKIDPQETVELYKKHNITPITNRLIAPSRNGACAVGIYYIDKLKSDGNSADLSPLDFLGVNFKWFRGFSDAFDAKKSNETPLFPEEYASGYLQGQSVRAAVIEEFGPLSSGWE